MLLIRTLAVFLVVIAAHPLDAFAQVGVPQTQSDRELNILSPTDNQGFATPPPSQFNAATNQPRQQPSPPPTVNTDGSKLPAVSNAEITQAELDTLVKQLGAATDLDEQSKTEALERTKSAAELLKKAGEALAKAAEYRVDISQAPAELARVKSDLATPPAEATFEVPERTTLPQLESFVADLETRLTKSRETLGKREEALQQRGDRKPELAKLLSDADDKMEKARTAVKSANDTATLAGVARSMEARAHLLARQRQHALYKVESQRYDAVAELLPLQRDLAKREVTFLEKLAAGWKERLVSRRQRDSDRQIAEAKRQVQEAQPALRQMARRNAAVAEYHKTLLKKIELIQEEVQDSNKRLVELKNDYDGLTAKVDKAGHSTTIGFLLRRQDKELPDVKACRNRIRFVRDELPKTHLALIESRDQREALGDVEATIARVLAELDAKVRQDRQTEPMVRDLLTSQRDLLDQSIRAHDEYVTLLAELELTQQDLIDQTREFTTYIDERVLWIRSSEPIGPADLRQAWAAILDLSVPARWTRLVGAVARRTVEKPTFAILAVVTMLLMIAGRRRLQRQLRRLVETDPQQLGLRFLPTLEALVASTLATAFWPGLMWLVGWQLVTSEFMPELGHAIGVGLESASFLFWMCLFARQLLSATGLGRQHFGWHESSLVLLRSRVTWLALGGVPIAFFVAAIGAYEDGQWAGSLGRLGFLVGCLAFALLAANCFGAKRGVYQGASTAAATSWFYRSRHLNHLLFVGFPLALAALSALGYDYSAHRLAMRLQATISVILATVVLHAVALRWLAVRRRVFHSSLAASSETLSGADDSPVPAAQVMSEAESEAGAAPEETNDRRQSPSPEFEEATDLQFRHLLRFAAAMGLLVLGYFVWSDITPALSVLDRLELWSKHVVIVEEIEDAQGNLVPHERLQRVATTYKQLVVAVMSLVLGLVLAHNLPALLQILVLERMPIDTGQRYAAGLIFRYAVTLAAILVACQVIGLTWGSIQWLAAAMTVGLGFGLQEIFANLVSGLIILFERPVRVGDLVTVGGVSGRVTRMQMRATTVTDFDRRELIVPNKKFITEDVMNWTLSDDVNRIVIEIGIAYGSDVQLARDLLLAVARRHPLVLADPAPIATFDRFADSSLNLTLRCFLPNLQHRLDTIHELHSKIDAEFRRANIEIAFPQQDLHLRSIDVPAQGLLSGDVREQGAA